MLHKAMVRAAWCVLVDWYLFSRSSYWRSDLFVQIIDETINIVLIEARMRFRFRPQSDVIRLPVQAGSTERKHQATFQIAFEPCVTQRNYQPV